MFTRRPFFSIPYFHVSNFSMDPALTIRSSVYNSNHVPNSMDRASYTIQEQMTRKRALMNINTHTKLRTVTIASFALLCWSLLLVDSQLASNGTQWNAFSIMQTCPCNEHPLTPHFYIVKLGCTEVYIFFLFLL